MKITIKEGEFKTGLSVIGFNVIAFRPSILNLESLSAMRFAGADIETQWIAGINNSTQKMDFVLLEIDWIHLHETIRFPFSMHNQHMRDFVRKIAVDKMVLLENFTDEQKEGDIVKSKGVSVEVSNGDVISWLDLEDQGKSVSDWQPPNPLWDKFRGVYKGRRI